LGSDDWRSSPKTTCGFSKTADKYIFDIAIRVTHKFNKSENTFLDKKSQVSDLEQPPGVLAENETMPV
jgi:hypothetical protein